MKPHSKDFKKIMASHTRYRALG